MATVERRGLAGADHEALGESVRAILDDGVAVEVCSRLCLVDTVLLTVEAGIVIAGVDTCLRYADGVGATAASASGSP